MKTKDCDVVVIGAGIGGLSAAAFMAKAGYKTIVVEKLPFVGGRASSLEYKGYKLTTGVGGYELILDDEIYKPLGLPFNVRVPEPNNVYYIGGKCHKVPEKGKLREALKLAAGEEETKKIMKVLKRALTWDEPSDSISLRDWLLQYTQNEKALGVFNASWQIAEVTAGGIIREIKREGSFPYGYAIGGNVNMINPFVDFIKSKRGEVLTRCRAQKILTSDGVAKGVIVTQKRGKEEMQLNCQAVISNVGPYGTVRLAGEENFDKGYLKEMHATIKTFPWLAFQVVSSEPLLEYPSVGFIVDGRIANWVLSQTMLCPEWAPPGKHLTYVGAWIPPNPPWKLEEYLDMAIQDLKDIAPKYDKYAEGLLHVAYFLRQEWPMYRSYDGHSMRQKTPIEKLYNVGDAVFPPGTMGMFGCALSGKLVSEDLVKRIKPQ
jgi:phytoene dehydrogenase-like protein